MFVGCKKSFLLRLIHVAWKCGCGLKLHTNKDQSFVNGSVFHAVRSLLHKGGNDYMFFLVLLYANADSDTYVRTLKFSIKKTGVWNILFRFVYTVYC